MGGVFLEHSQDVKTIFLFLVLCTLVVFFISLIAGRNAEISKIIYIGFALRLITLVAIGFFGILPYTYDSGWDEIAQHLLVNWHSGVWDGAFIESPNVRYYTFLVTAVYYIFGYNPIFMMLLNVLWGTLTIVVIYSIANLLFDKKSAIISASLIAFWPTHIMFSAMNMRDSLAVLLMVLFILNFLKWIKTPNLPLLLSVLLLIIGNTMIRSQNAVIISVVAIPIIFYYLFKRSDPYLKPIYIMVGIVGVLGAVAAMFALGYSSYLDINYITREMNYRADGGAAYLTSLNYTSWLDVLLYLPLRFIYFLFSPFLWDVGNISQALAAIEGLILMVMSAVILRKRKMIGKITKNKHLLWAFVIFCIIGLGANSIIDSNSGTAVRHKLQYLSVIFVLYGATKYKQSDDQ
ncbi:hypothetical protein BSK59_02180 [Paenibacillus odorifer]|nr:hypothetical protein BSK59_02180 [Paenibacillus odorifer]